MKLKIGSKYKLVVNVNNNILTFSCTVDQIDEHFVTFTDKYGKQYAYNLNTVVSFEEVGA